MKIIAHELGCPGHLSVSQDCLWRRHTQIGEAFRVSTVGEYWPEGKRERHTLGAGRDEFFETMVFATTNAPVPNSDGCGCLSVEDYAELSARRYATPGEAQRGHEEMVAKYLAIARKMPTKRGEK